MKLIATALIVIFVTGVAGTLHFWPSARDQQILAFFSILQFLATFALILLTYVYVNETRKYVATAQQQINEQNREPTIRVISHLYPTTTPFVASFEVEIANPSIRATSVTIKAVNIDQEVAKEVYFGVYQDRQKRLVIGARELQSVGVKADFQDSIPILHANQGCRTARLIFDDVFHGTLAPVTYQF